MGKTKKAHLGNRSTQSRYSSSLSPDIRRRSPRGNPIATPVCSTKTNPSEPSLKKRQWCKRNRGNRSKKDQPTQKNTSRYANAATCEPCNDQKNKANTNSTTNPTQHKNQKPFSHSTPKSTKRSPIIATTRVTRSQVQQQSEEQDRHDDNNSTNSKIMDKNKFVIPRKHHIKTGPVIIGVASLEENGGDNDDTVSCPYCLQTISLDGSKVLARAYREVKQKYKADQGQAFSNLSNRLLSKEQQDHFALPIYPDARKPKRPVALREWHYFCQLHTVELEVKPQGIKLGWPTVVQFDALNGRILSFKKELDMVISKEMDSSFRKMALQTYDQIGKHQARSVFGRMARFQHTLPGYYGTKGASVIQESLANMYLHSGKLCRDVTSPQTGMEYLQQVLIPEVGFRLIREDIISKNESKRNDPDIDQLAKSVMYESVTFGSYLQPVDWQDSISSDEE